MVYGRKKIKRQRPLPTEPAPFSIYVDADACPVKSEVYRVAIRNNALVYLVSNQRMRAPDQLGLRVKIITVSEGADVADQWIVEHIEPYDICVTSDIPLAAKCVDARAFVLSPRGREWTEDTVGAALAKRDLMTSLREQDWGGMELPTSGPPPMDDRAKSQFLNAIDRLIQRAKKAHQTK
jgi:uncharacterized protein